MSDIEKISYLVSSRLSVSNRDWLDRPFNETKICEALFQMHSNKSPGPDRLLPLLL